MSPAKWSGGTDRQQLISYDPSSWADCPTTPSAVRAGVALIALGAHLFPSTWQPGDWVTAVIGGQIAEHCPPEPGLQGPILFCCLKAFDLQRQYYPQSGVAQAQWRLTRPQEVAGWAGSDKSVVYFVFCDPIRSSGLRAIALQGPLLAEVLRRQRPLEALTPYADEVG